MAKGIGSTRRDTKPRGKRPCAVWVTPEEREGIERLASAAGLSMSAYLRTLGLSYEPRSVLDAERVGDLLKACGDLAQLGGVLKLWLAEQPGEGGSTEDVRALLCSMRELRDTVADKVKKIEVRR
ncbi:plasmid mobilization protein [Acidisoma sp. 7E03]